MRKLTKLSIIAIASLSIGIISRNVSAAPRTCDALVARCVSESSKTRSACFQKYTESPSCSRSPLSRIVAKRIKYAPQSRKTERRVRSSRGAKPVEPLCLDYFDIQLRNAIDFGPINTDRQKALIAQLRRCSIRTSTTASMVTGIDSAPGSSQ